MKLLSREEIIEFEKQQQDLDNQITNLYEQGDDADVLPLFDGVVNPVNYFNSNPKILWILKEPHDGTDDKGNPNGGGWPYREDLNDNFSKYSKNKTWKKIAYTSYGILNHCFYIDIKAKDKNLEVFEVIRDISFINIKKTPGRTESKYREIKKAYAISCKVLHQQINLFNPDVIIGGGILNFLINDLGLEEFKKEGHGLKYYIKDKTLFIDAYHPSSFNLTDEEYANQIISVFMDYKIKYK